jgi:hypothetical protein
MKAHILFFISGLLFAIAAIINIAEDPNKKTGYIMFLPAVAMILAGIAKYRKNKRP